MASTYSFDVVSEYDQQELVNALDQTRREVAQRYDLKDSKTEIEQEKEEIHINSESEMTLTAVTDILTSKVLRRNLSLKILDMQEPEPAAGGRIRQTIKLKKGISSDLAREISKVIRDTHPKAKPQIQGDAVRVTSASKDELQQIITTLKGKEFPVALQFTNYR